MTTELIASQVRARVENDLAACIDSVTSITKTRVEESATHTDARVLQHQIGAIEADTLARLKAVKQEHFGIVWEGSKVMERYRELAECRALALAEEEFMREEVRRCDLLVRAPIDDRQLHVADAVRGCYSEYNAILRGASKDVEDIDEEASTCLDNSMLPCEIWSMVVVELAALDPPGCHRPHSWNEDYTTMTLGFYRLAHTCSQLRAIVLKHGELFAPVVLSMGNEEAADHFARLSGAHPLTLDFDQAMATSRTRDISNFFYHVLDKPAFLHRARELRCTLGLEDQIVASTNYVRRGPIEDLLSFVEENASGSLLERLTFPMFDTHDYTPKFKSTTLTYAHFIGLHVREHIAWYRPAPAYEGFVVEVRQREDVEAYVENLLELLEGCPNLKTIIIEQVTWTDDGDLLPVETGANFVVKSLGAEGVERMMAHVRTTGTWDVRTTSSLSSPFLRDLVYNKTVLHLHYSSEWTCASYQDDGNSDTGMLLDDDTRNDMRDLSHPYAFDLKIRLGCVVVSTSSRPDGMEFYRTSLDLLTIQDVGYFYGGGDVDWTCLKALKSLHTLVLHTERDVSNILQNCKPRNIVVHCSRPWRENPSVLGLIEALHRYEEDGTLPESITLEGRKTRIYTETWPVLPGVVIRDRRV
ncbi:unnamed protein product [Peniophora sp. CBMAI 1063]|nr:unnamed protein product [Peniophora sp. CBMAI 1063]